ncbi:RpoE, DNA-directed RNA polymerase specialized sigma subunit, sigma24-like [Pediococcus inopinatus]|nr:RpoE, DNA-directed RNA polymerase specialized sigma subunit, sigma24-like [Pediococcus inopinatus]
MTKGPWILAYKEIQELEKQTIQAGFNFLLQDDNEKIIFGAAKRLHISPVQTNYDDFIQEGYLAFVQAYARYPSLVADDPQKFRVFAYQAVYWRLLDLIRQTSRVAEKIQFDQETLDAQPQSSGDLAFDAIYTDQLFQELYQCCTLAEQNFLKDCYVLHLKNNEIAAKHHVSRQCVSNLRRSVGNKALAQISKNSH